MNENKFDKLESQIREHLDKLHTELDRFDELMSDIQDDPALPDWQYTENVANRFHNFYMGVEHIFERIAKEVDGRVPKKDDWHKELLRRMTRDSENRPAVIPESLRPKLMEYLQFRHFERHGYSTDLKWEQMKNLMENFRDVHDETTRAIEQFLAKIDASP